MSTAPNRNGYLNKTKWLLVEEAPLTGSGLNEVVLMAETADKLRKCAATLGYKTSGRAAYKVVKLEDVTATEEASK